MDFDEYISRIESRPRHSKLGRAKRMILERLWPGLPVSGRELFELTNQTYYDRRIRELRDETGCDIVTNNSDNSYTLRSHKLGQGNRRLYLTASQKKTLLASSLYKCAVCRTEFQETDNRLQELGGVFFALRFGPAFNSNSIVTS